MLRKLMWNGIKEKPLEAAGICIFTAITSMLFGITLLLFMGLSSSISALMEKAQTPDFLQMHTGNIDVLQIEKFAEKREDILEWQVSQFLNLENSSIVLQNQSLSDSTQENGVCVQSEKFDFLIDADAVLAEQTAVADCLPHVLEGEIYAPVCYRKQYHLQEGDVVQIGKNTFHIAGFIRDSQMNSMMASSKRFLVCKKDYEKLLPIGEEEYLIEFLLQEGSSINQFAESYMQAGLPANGPTITYPLIRMLNTLSDGMMIFLILLVSTVLSGIFLLCMRFLLLTQIERSRREIGMLKAVGIGKKQIRFLYFARLLGLSGLGLGIGFAAAFLAEKPLAAQTRELYGSSPDKGSIYMGTLLGMLLLFSLQMYSLWRILKKIEKISAIQAIQGIDDRKEKSLFQKYLFVGMVTAISLFLIIIPQNLYSTISSPKFVTYMGIGEGQLRLDIRQTEKGSTGAEEILISLQKDSQVEKCALFQTISQKVKLPDETKSSLMIEMGNHTIFPVTYTKGQPPEKENELALSVLNAKELQLQVGDVLFSEGGQVYHICGIYSDITNGGKTAKAYALSDVSLQHTDKMWSVIYLTLGENVIEKEWISKYQKEWKIGRLSSIQEYVKSIYGQTIHQIRLAAGLTMICVGSILCLVIFFFVRLMAEEERFAISLRKALGFTGKEVAWLYLKKLTGSILSGIIMGILLGNLAGNQLAGGFLSNMGAAGFSFIVDKKMSYFLLPAGVGLLAFCGAKWGMKFVYKVRSYECCMGERS